ncbi:hypothetical protein G7046_g4479 [Stylonectria norvegica]|nr:hypothetical protein G7046_g4479 [Stylonectria norvegica]
MLYSRPRLHPRASATLLSPASSSPASASSHAPSRRARPAVLLACVTERCWLAVAPPPSEGLAMDEEIHVHAVHAMPWYVQSMHTNNSRALTVLPATALPFYSMRYSWPLQLEPFLKLMPLPLPPRLTEEPLLRYPIPEPLFQLLSDLQLSNPLSHTRKSPARTTRPACLSVSLPPDICKPPPYLDYKHANAARMPAAIIDQITRTWISEPAPPPASPLHQKHFRRTDNMGKLIKNHWARLIIMSAAAYQVGAAIESFIWPKIFWDFLTHTLDAAVKPFPVLQIINLVLGLGMLAIEWPLGFLAGSPLHRSLEFRLAVLPLTALAAALIYQGTNSALYYLIGMGVYFWAYSEGEVSSSCPLFKSNKFADKKPPLDHLRKTMDFTTTRSQRWYLSCVMRSLLISRGAGGPFQESNLSTLPLPRLAPKGQNGLWRTVYTKRVRRRT